MNGLSRSRLLASCLPVAALLLGFAGCARRPPGEMEDLDAETAAAPFVELVRLRAQAPLRGDMVGGTQGDWLLRNERIAVVVGGVVEGDRSHAGWILDAAPEGGFDLLAGIHIAAGAAGSAGAEGLVDLVAPDTAGMGESRRGLLVRAHLPERPWIRVETRFILEAGSHALAVATRFLNMGTDTTLVPTADLILWGQAEPFAPGPGFEPPSPEEEVPYLTGAGRGTAYGWWSPDGSLNASGGPNWSRAGAETLRLAPGEAARVERRFVVRRGSAAGVGREMADTLGTATGWVTVEAGWEHDPVRGVRVEVRGPDGRSWSWGETSERGSVELAAPASRITLLASHPRYGISPIAPLVIKERGRAHASLHLLEPASLGLHALDAQGHPSPARWRFEGLQDTRTPWFGPRHQASGAAEFLFTPSGASVALVPPGSYRIRATRGPAFEAWETVVTLTPGSHSELHAKLTPIAIPEDWVAVTGRTFGASSPSLPMSPADRSRRLVCDGFAWVGPGGGVPPGVPDSLNLAAALGVLGDAGSDAPVAGASVGATTWDPAAGEERIYAHAPGGTAAEVREALRGGKTLSTNGPFVEFTLEGTSIGGRVRRGPGMARGHLRVLAAGWVDVRRVLVLVNGVVDAVYMVRGREGHLRFDEDIEFYVNESGPVSIRVEGDDPLDAAGMGPARPLAVTGPIWVDIPEAGR